MECIKVAKIYNKHKEQWLKALKHKIYQAGKRSPEKTKRTPISITEHDAYEILEEQGFRCARTNVALTFDVGGPNWHSTKPACKSRNHMQGVIDRIDSSKGYSKDNIQIVMDMYNTLKGDLPDMAMQALGMLTYWKMRMDLHEGEGILKGNLKKNWERRFNKKADEFAKLVKETGTTTKEVNING